MAAPIVAGVAAMASQVNPDARAADIIHALKQTATRPAGSGWNADLGWGILNAGAAIKFDWLLGLEEVFDGQTADYFQVKPYGFKAGAALANGALTDLNTNGSLTSDCHTRARLRRR